MAKTINLTVTKHEYENRESGSRLGHDYYVRDANGIRFNRASLSQFDAIDTALLEVLKRAANSYYEADVTIYGATLPESLQTHLTDKYEVETQINGITFA